MTDDERRIPDHAARIRQLFTSLYAGAAIPAETHTAADADLAALTSELTKARDEAAFERGRREAAYAIRDEYRDTADRLGRRAATAEGDVQRLIAALVTLAGNMEQVDPYWKRAEFFAEHGVADLLDQPHNQPTAEGLPRRYTSTMPMYENTTEGLRRVDDEPHNG